MYDIEIKMFDHENADADEIDGVNITGFKTREDARAAYVEACALLEARAGQSLRRSDK